MRRDSRCTLDSLLETKSEVSKQQEQDVRVVVVRGLPGSGKTLTTWHIWREFMNQVRDHDTSYRTPVHISLPDFRSAITDKQDLMHAYFKRYIPQALGVCVEEFRSQAKLFVILDGLDEVKHKPVNLWRDNGLAKWKHCRFLLTVRRGFLMDSQFSDYVDPCHGMIVFLVLWL